MWAQMPPGGSTPTHSRRKLGEPVTSSDGTTPELTDRWSWYTSSMNRLRALSRWTSPASISCHSSEGMTRGMMSKGQGRSVTPVAPSYTVKVTPMARISRSAASWRSARASGPRSAKWRQSGSAAGLGAPPAVHQLVVEPPGS